MYHKGNRESMDCMDDIVLIQASGVENDNAIQDLKVNTSPVAIDRQALPFVRRLARSND